MKNQSNEVTIPVATKAVLSLRNLGYNNYEAIADIIDNSIDNDVNAKNVNIKITPKFNEVIIADDGCGMSMDTLLDALKYGSEGGDIATNDLGRFGMGLKTAATSMGRSLKVFSKEKNGELISGLLDIDLFIDKGDFVYPINNISSDEANMFNEMTNNCGHGTMIVISKIDNLNNHSLPQFKSKLIKDIARIFRYFIEDGIKFTVNGKSISAIYPDLRHTDKYRGKLINDKDYNFRYLIPFNGEDRVVNLKIKLYVLPHSLAEKKVGEAENVNYKTRGFYILRNNREISFAKGLNLFSTSDNRFNRFRGELFFSGEIDDILSVSVQKNSITIPDELLTKLKADIKPKMAYIRSLLVDDGNKSKLSGDDEELVTIKDSINSNSNRVKPDTIIRPNEVRGKVKRTNGTVTDDVTESDSKRNYPSNTTKRSRDIISELQYVDMGERGNMITYNYDGNGTVSLKINIKHSLYSEFIENLSETNKNVFIKFCFTQFRAQEKILKDKGMISEDDEIETKDMFDDMLRHASDEFRKLF